MDSGEFIKITGAIAGIIALGWNVFREFKSYLILNLEISSQDEVYLLKTGVENNSYFTKRIENSFLIIAPENEDIVSVGNKIFNGIYQTEITSTNELIYLTYNDKFSISKEILFIPMNFYFLENIGVGNEKLNYTSFINSNELKKGNYSVRFFVFDKRRLHRSTQDLLVIK